jgi:hypothetical protein
LRHDPPLVHWENIAGRMVNVALNAAIPGKQINQAFTLFHENAGAVL